MKGLLPEIILEIIKDNYDLGRIKYLINNGYDIHYRNDQALRWSNSFGNKMDLVQFLVENGADIHANNDEALINSVDEDSLEVMKYLLIQGANIKVLTKDEQLKYKYYYSVKIVLFLLDFHFKRETEFSKNKLADCNILKIVFSYI